jgi:hypothetical protein
MSWYRQAIVTYTDGHEAHEHTEVDDIHGRGQMEKFVALRLDCEGVESVQVHRTHHIPSKSKGHYR